MTDHEQLAQEMRHDLASDAARRRESRKRAPIIAKMHQMRRELGLLPVSLPLPYRTHAGGGSGNAMAARPVGASTGAGRGDGNALSNRPKSSNAGTHTGA